MLTCRFFTWQVDTCRGPLGCSSDGPARARCDQREARMLVSDLLEIGVQQRKAFQDARQKAAAATPTPPQN